MYKDEFNEIIKTERLKLTPLNVKDVERFVEIAKKMRSVKEKNSNYFLFARFNDEFAKTNDDLQIAAINLLTCAKNSLSPEISKRFNICLNSGYIIGYIGFVYNPQNEKNSDLGIFLDPDYEHKGYAFEALKSLLTYYFLNYGDNIYLTIYPKNFPSYHLFQKFGAVKIDYKKQTKYGQERDILIITRKIFLKNVFSKEFPTAKAENQFLDEYLQIYNKI